jgi:hypothetical protein
MSDIIIGGVYRHYKGKLYRVKDIAINTETMESMVIYEPLYDSSVKSWVRPKTMWFESVQVEDSVVPRFKLEPNDVQPTN